MNSDNIVRIISEFKSCLSNILSPLYPIIHKVENYASEVGTYDNETYYIFIYFHVGSLYNIDTENDEYSISCQKSYLYKDKHMVEIEIKVDPALRYYLFYRYYDNIINLMMENWESTEIKYNIEEEVEKNFKEINARVLKFKKNMEKILCTIIDNWVKRR